MDEKKQISKRAVNKNPTLKTCLIMTTELSTSLLGNFVNSRASLSKQPNNDTYFNGFLYVVVFSKLPIPTSRSMPRSKRWTTLNT